MWQKLLWIAIAGACGTLARYGLSGIVHRWFGSDFPWGTVIVNVIGCFVFGIVWALAGEKGVVSAEARVVILVGFMGAFTTFSTFISETGQLMSDSALLIGLANVALQLTAGIGVFFLGLTLGRVF